MTGRCLCGAVRFTARKVGSEFGVCLCGICRKWGGGGPMFAVDCG
ncbi:MAG: GFA family protein, partial [Alphaproteobacteria bacterium]